VEVYEDDCCRKPGVLSQYFRDHVRAVTGLSRSHDHPVTTPVHHENVISDIASEAAARSNG
jgi:hypothetical protein